MALDDPSGLAAKSSRTPMIIAIVGAVVLGVLFIGGIIAVLAVSGVRRYLASAKSAEGRNSVAAIARGVASCAAREVTVGGMVAPHGLPASSRKVPATLGQVSNKKYASTPADWSGDPAFACARFEMSTPQYFQYQWVLAQPGKKGVVHAVADLDGDGAPDLELEADVTCTTPGACEAGPLRETPR